MKPDVQNRRWSLIHTLSLACIVLGFSYYIFVRNSESIHTFRTGYSIGKMDHAHDFDRLIATKDEKTQIVLFGLAISAGDRSDIYHEPNRTLYQWLRKQNGKTDSEEQKQVDIFTKGYYAGYR